AEETALDAARREPQLLVAAMAKQDRSMTQGKLTAALGDAVLVAANEREGRVIYAELCGRAGVPEIGLKKLKGNTAGFEVSIPHDQGGRRSITFITLPDTGPKEAAAAVDDILDWRIPKIFLFVGCGGEITSKHRTPTTKPLVVVAR